MADSNILLESGTNELEILEFTIGDNIFGINVAKVRELIQYSPVQPIPRSQMYVEGIFCPRNEVYTVINLASYLGLPPSEDQSQDMFIVTSFNKVGVAFHVHKVRDISRYSWENVERPSSSLFGGEEGIVTGIVKSKGTIISIIDFEKIMYDINPRTSVEAYAENITEAAERKLYEKYILIAEDSELLLKLITASLDKAGYHKRYTAKNGQEAWDLLKEMKDAGESIQDNIGCVITDIEMPLMDGHRLTKLIKNDNVLNILPVIIFSSLISEEMAEKGREVGADYSLSKPDIDKLVGILDELVL